jgi:single-strand DNA-binding protein
MASRDINVSTISGKLTRAPEVRYTRTGKTVCNFGVASHSMSGTGASRKEATMFIDVTVFERAAEACAKALSVGSPVLVDGRLVSQSWTTEKGEKRNKHSIVANKVQFLGSRRDAEAA